ncbi:uncharacterized protein [Eurosta solidaginis]|uniref:uncharacterized protein n=1 Tax=Eurosta solidaginis TaxID=178769 RepID=UPI00353108CC
MTIEYSKDIEDPPEYIDLNFIKDFTENALRQTDLKILKAHIKMGSAVGDNFCSRVYRAKIQYELPNSPKHNELSVFVKCMPPIVGVSFLNELQFFAKEKITFEEILPKLSLFLEQDERFSGRIYHSLKRPVNCLAFEDLNVSGFQMASRESGLDEKHARLVMKRIGQFHAISMHLARKDPFIPKFYEFGFLSRHAIKPGSFLYGYIEGTAKALYKLISRWPEYSKIAEKVRRYNENLHENLVQAQALRSDDHFWVLNHGDLWVNNLLFRYADNNQVTDCAFIDFQMTYWGSPGVDLNYFLYTSIQFDVLKNKREELLKVYYSNLLAKLEELNYKPLPSFQQLLDEVRRRASYGFMAHYAIHPMIIQDKSTAGDSSLDNLADKDFAEKKNDQIFSSKQLEVTLRYTLKEFEKMGVWN